MSFPPPSTETYTDLTTYYYKTNCSDIIDINNQYISCKKKVDMFQCCESLIHYIYNVSYDFNKCYLINNTYVEFRCNEETDKDNFIALIVFSCIAFCICICGILYVCIDTENKNEKQYLNVHQNASYHA